MKSQRNQLFALIALLVIWAVSWSMIRTPPGPPPVVVKAAAAVVKSSAVQDNLLRNRFHRIRSEMDGLYHYRIKPAPFDPAGNPFRINGVTAVGDNGASGQQQERAAFVTPNQPQPPVEAVETGSALLRHAIEAVRIGGVVTRGEVTELTVDGQLHKEGEVFTTRVKARVVLIRIKHLTTSAVTFALDDPDAGTAEMRVRLK